MSNMDREAREQYLVVVLVKDMLGLNGGYSASTTVTISLTDVNDNGPTFQHSESHQSLPQSQCATSNPLAHADSHHKRGKEYEYFQPL